jgi:chromosome segregation ATPase
MKRTVAAGIFLSVLLLSACSGPAAGEQLDTVLNDTFDAEKEYRETQKEMEELEKDEQQLFESIMALTQEQQDEVESQAKEALASAEERLELLKTEKESMNKARENFKEIDAVIAEADDAQIKEELEALKQKMQERFDSHGQFTEAYETLNGLQQELYTMLMDEETELPVLQEKAIEINKQNTAVQEAVTAFNNTTEQFNKMKNQIVDNIEKSEE